MGHQADLIDVCVNLNLISANECETLIELLSDKVMRQRLAHFQCEECEKNSEMDIDDLMGGFGCGHDGVCLDRELTGGCELYKIQGHLFRFRFVDEGLDFLRGYGRIEFTRLLIKLMNEGALIYEHLISYNETRGGYYDEKAAREEKARRGETCDLTGLSWNDFEAQAERIPTRVLLAALGRRLYQG